MKIDGSCALVTGAGSGLGEATARLLAGLGARVGVFDLNAEAAARVAADIGGLALTGDVTDETAAGAAMTAAEAAFGPLRILVNCAGIGTASRIVGRDGPMPLAAFERVIRVNLVGTFNMMRLAAARMAAAEALDDGARGVIVNTASVAAFDGQIGQAAYAASKGGIVSLALPAAREFARSGIRVNTIAPGIFLTPLLHTLPQEAQQSLAASIPYPSRLGDPAEFADAVRFFVENQYANGEVLRLDGAVRLAPR
ncbi:SDR family NAD(P)-dependent oxidoreductase [Polymorphum gilvum]|uniref:3-hydroxyacyl-CoA dehydrogenase type II n=1 Tax=Polymorphum gilvum (strain LMG 25793 / CGMCC 1.9160 / SL003B-26A1) TaxID=991905 RepID=F2J6C0_POLGS|nr:SDR family NAD(P)-dependent oxidoreductase [Polymorphum gilvum]ADZ71294.1 3-hydroxyacyl-CoA dehydrogenase type II [Polymorphum gilvum SL003B-26A1]